MFQEYNKQIDYYEFKTKIEVNGKHYSAFGSIDIDFDVKLDEDYSGTIYVPENVEMNVFDISLVSDDLEEIDEKTMSADLYDRVVEQLLEEIHPRDFEEKMIEKYLEIN